MKGPGASGRIQGHFPSSSSSSQLPQRAQEHLRPPRCPQRPRAPPLRPKPSGDLITQFLSQCRRSRRQGPPAVMKGPGASRETPAATLVTQGISHCRRRDPQLPQPAQAHPRGHSCPQRPSAPPLNLSRVASTPQKAHFWQPGYW